jgi:predicted nucleotidyltransferase
MKVYVFNSVVIGESEKTSDVNYLIDMNDKKRIQGIQDA